MDWDYVPAVDETESPPKLRRSLRSRTPIVRYEEEFPAPSTSKKRKSGQRSRSRLNSRMPSLRRSVSSYRGQSELRHHNSNLLGTFEQNLQRRSFVAGFNRPPTYSQLKALFYHVTQARVNEIFIYKAIRNDIVNERPDDVRHIFDPNIESLERAIDGNALTEHELYEKYRNVQSQSYYADLSTWIVFIEKSLHDVTIRCTDAIHHSRSILTARQYKLLSKAYSPLVEKNIKEFEAVVEMMFLNGPSLAYYHMYKPKLSD